MNILRTLLALSLLGVSSLAMADPQDYTNAELFVGRQGSLYLNGAYAYRFAGSYDINDTFYAFGSFTYQNYGTFLGSTAGTYVKNDDFALGAGIHNAIADASDWVARFSLVRNRTSTSLPVAPSHTGYDLGTGFNTAITTGLELSTFIDHSTAGTDATTGLPSYTTANSSETILSAGLHVQVGRSTDFGITEEYNNFGQSNLYFSLRWDF